MPADPAPVHPAVTAVAHAFADWVESVRVTRAEIRADVAAAGGDPDGPEVEETLREVVTDAVPGLPPGDRAASAWVIAGVRDRLDAPGPAS